MAVLTILTERQHFKLCDPTENHYELQVVLLVHFSNTRRKAEQIEPLDLGQWYLRNVICKCNVSLGIYIETWKILQ